MDGEEELPAGEFSSWVRLIRRARATGADVDVPCGTCTACCRSSYFIHIRPDEARTLRRIPRPLLAPAPGLPAGNVVMGFDEHGRCPMLIDDACSIYEDRPRTCRQFDCRVFAAADVSPEDDGKPLIARQVRRWRFDHPTARDRDEHTAVRAAAVFLRRGPECFPDGRPPSTAGDVAGVAVEVHEVFLGTEESDDESPDVETVRAALRRAQVNE